jgi:nitrite reductase/ring-hydroxylating ferredoxin subunit/uncharacterized membrane protein
MRSRAQLLSHPVHPMLVPFPIAFLIGALAFDIIGLVSGAAALWVTAAHLQLAGLATGLLAAVPGIVDYLFSVPPESSAKTRATRHGLGNAGALVLFALAWLARDAAWQPGLLTVALELAGGGLLAYGGYLGGTLVTRNMIGVDHRYAEAGRWQEASFQATAGQPVVVGRADDLEPGQMKLLHVNGRRLVLARTDAGYRIFDDRCSHRGASLAGGVLVGNVVHCLWHGSQFDTGDGSVACGPAKKAVGVYDVKETKDGQVILQSAPR